MAVPAGHIPGGHEPGVHHPGGGEAGATGSVTSYLLRVPSDVRALAIPIESEKRRIEPGREKGRVLL